MPYRKQRNGQNRLHWPVLPTLPISLFPAWHPVQSPCTRLNLFSAVCQGQPELRQSEFSLSLSEGVQGPEGLLFRRQGGPKDCSGRTLRMRKVHLHSASPPILQSQQRRRGNYRVTVVVTCLGCVDLALGCSTILDLAQPYSQFCHSRMAKIVVKPTPNPSRKMCAQCLR